MSLRLEDGNGGLDSISEQKLPDPDPALLAQIDAMGPVRTRRPARSMLLLAIAAGAVVALHLLAYGPRRDLAALPAVWVAALAVAWTAAILATLLRSTVPRKAEVLPDPARAGWTAGLAAATLLLLGLFATVSAPGATMIPATTWPSFARSWWHCTGISLAAIFPILLLGGLIQRRLFPSGGIRIAAALGAAAGAIAGLSLHFICPIGGALHVGFAHAGAVTLGALLGMLLLPPLLRL
jgi:hypothetical protein